MKPDMHESEMFKHISYKEQVPLTLTVLLNTYQEEEL